MAATSKPARRRMNVSSAMRNSRAAATVSGIALFGLASAVPGAEVQGFIVSHMAYALSKDASETGACPNGMTKGNTELFSLSAEGRRHDGESDQDYGRRVGQGAQ